MLDALIAETDQTELKLVAQAQRDGLAELRLETENITLYNRAITLAKLLKRDLDVDLRHEAHKIKRQLERAAGPAP